MTAERKSTIVDQAFRLLAAYFSSLPEDERDAARMAVGHAIMADASEDCFVHELVRRAKLSGGVVHIHDASEYRCPAEESN